MKLLRFCLLPLLLTGCDKSTTADTNTAPPAAVEPKVATCALPVYDLRHLHPQPTQRLDSIQVQGLYIRDAQLRQDFAYYSGYEDVYVLDTVRCAGFTLLTLYRYDESNFHNLYYITLDPAAQRVRQAKLIATWGSDGDWLSVCTMHRAGRRLRVLSVTENDSHERDEYTTHTTDSLIWDYHLTPQGRLVMTRVDSARQIVHTRRR